MLIILFSDFSEKYSIKIDEEALNDLREIVVWYNNVSNDLGLRFHKQVKSQINSLKKIHILVQFVIQTQDAYLLKNFHLLYIT